MSSNAKLYYPEIEYLDKEEINKLPGFEKCLVMFANNYNGQTCSLDIEGDGNFRQFVIRRETLITYVPEEHFRQRERVRYLLIFLDDKDHAEDAIKYLKEHWISGVSKMKVQTIVDVRFAEDTLTSNAK